MFYGVVEDVMKHDQDKVREVGENQTYVGVVLSGNTERKNKLKMNTGYFIINDEYLTLEVPSPTSKVYAPHMDELECVKWFRKDNWGWVVKEQDGCVKCGSPWCDFEQKRDRIEGVIRNIEGIRNTTNDKRRQMAYRVMYI